MPEALFFSDNAGELMKSIIEYFAKRHLLVNIIAIGTIIAAFFAWQSTGKEAMPDVAFDIVRVTTSYRNATPSDVEYFITEPLEKAINGISGIISVSSTSGAGQSSIVLEIENNKRERANIINEIRSAVLETRLPDEADTPRIREIKTSERSVLNVALVDRRFRVLDPAGRKELQDHSETLKHRLERIEPVREVNYSGFLEKEIHVVINPERLDYYNLALTDVIDTLSAYNIRQPAGSIKDGEEIKVSIISELDTEEKIRELIIRATFDGATVRLKDLGPVKEEYEEYTTITKYNGHEGIRLNIVKISSAGIIEANDLIMAEIENYRNTALKNTFIETVLMDDESVSVRDRLSLISINGLIGFVFVIITLFLFLDFTSGFWVAAGIPFSFCFTMIFVYLSGYTINNMTLAAVILVMGMVVDDAIVVAENVGRMRHNGTDRKTAVVEGTHYVLKPVIASILTTCVAFIPLYFFSGRFGNFVAFIPLLIFLMLGGSLLEATLILPSHLSIVLPGFLKRKNKKGKGHWFDSVENLYGRVLEKILAARFLLYLVFVALLILSFKIASEKMSFALFPREEVTRVNIEGIAPPGTDRYATAELAMQVEELFVPYTGKEIIAFRTDIARSRRGASVEENRFNISIQLVTRDKREKSSAQLIREWEELFNNVTGLESLRVVRGWFGQSSGSPIEVIVFENNDRRREEIAAGLAEAVASVPGISSSEVQEIKKIPEYRIDYRKDVMQRLSISSSSVTKTLRSILNNYEVFKLNREGGIEVPVNVSVPEKYREKIENTLSIPVKNSSSYLVPLGRVVTYERSSAPETILREDYRRTLRVYADIKENYSMTPGEAGDLIESEIFPQFLAHYPTANLKFGGEIRDTRESGNDLLYSSIAVVVIIYVILVLLFNSLLKPFIIMISIPFGVCGVIFALYFHGISVYGFFSAIGLIGLAGVVVNDAIVMLVKLEREYEKTEKSTVRAKVAEIAKTRLRAVLLTTITTVAGLVPTAYGFAGYDSMLSDMMLVMAWGLIFGTLITLLLIPMLYCSMMTIKNRWRRHEKST